MSLFDAAGDCNGVLLVRLGIERFYTEHVMELQSNLRIFSRGVLVHPEGR